MTRWRMSCVTAEATGGTEKKLEAGRRKDSRLGDGRERWQMWLEWRESQEHRRKPSGSGIQVVRL